jgi:hypothetical protein
MLIGMIKNHTRVVGNSQGYLGLPIRDVTVNCSVNGPETPAMETAWFPTPAELEALNKGAPVVVRILGTSPPPMMVMIGDLPEAG